MGTVQWKYMYILGHNVKYFLLWVVVTNVWKATDIDSIGENPEGMRKHHSGGDCSGAEVGGRRLHAMAELSGMTRYGTGSGTDVARWQFGWWRGEESEAALSVWGWLLSVGGVVDPQEVGARAEQLGRVLRPVSVPLTWPCVWPREVSGSQSRAGRPLSSLLSH